MTATWEEWWSCVLSLSLGVVTVETVGTVARVEPVVAVMAEALRTDDFFSNLVLSVECNGDRARFMLS